MNINDYAYEIDSELSISKYPWAKDTTRNHRMDWIKSSIHPARFVKFTNGLDKIHIVNVPPVVGGVLITESNNDWPVPVGGVDSSVQIIDDTIESLRGKGIFTTEVIKRTSLHGIHKSIERINGHLYFPNNEIKESILGVLLIDGLTEVRINNYVNKIINKYLNTGRAGLLECQRELIENNLDQYAKL